MCSSISDCRKLATEDDSAVNQKGAKNIESQLAGRVP
jgi:hypothetical protein